MEVGRPHLTDRHSHQRNKSQRTTGEISSFRTLQRKNQLSHKDATWSCFKTFDEFAKSSCGCGRDQNISNQMLQSTTQVLERHPSYCARICLEGPNIRRLDESARTRTPTVAPCDYSACPRGPRRPPPPPPRTSRASTRRAPRHPPSALLDGLLPLRRVDELPGPRAQLGPRAQREAAVPPESANKTPKSCWLYLPGICRNRTPALEHLWMVPNERSRREESAHTDFAVRAPALQYLMDGPGLLVLVLVGALLGKLAWSDARTLCYRGTLISSTASSMETVSVPFRGLVIRGIILPCPASAIGH